MTNDAPEVRRARQMLDKFKELKHSHLLLARTWFDYGPRLCIVMDLASGNLSQRLELEKRRRPGNSGIPVAELLEHFKGVASALDYLHDLGFQHRDVKPQNILLVDGVARLADFDLVKEMAYDRLVTTSLKSVSPAYQAPEMCDGKFVNRKSDQYCFAYTYAELRLGERPFRRKEKNLDQLRVAHKTEKPNLKTLGAAEEEILLKALAKKPEDRFGSCTEFVRELQDAIHRDQEWKDEWGQKAQPDLPPVRPPHKVIPSPPARRYQQAVGLLLALMVIGAVGVAAVVFWPKSKPGTSPTPFAVKPLENKIEEARAECAGFLDVFKAIANEDGLSADQRRELQSKACDALTDCVGNAGDKLKALVDLKVPEIHKMLEGEQRKRVRDIGLAGYSEPCNKILKQAESQVLDKPDHALAELREAEKLQAQFDLLFGDANDDDVFARVGAMKGLARAIGFYDAKPGRQLKEAKQELDKLKPQFLPTDTLKREHAVLLALVDARLSGNDPVAAGPLVEVLDRPNLRKGRVDDAWDWLEETEKKKSIFTSEGLLALEKVQNPSKAHFGRIVAKHVEWEVREAAPWPNKVQWRRLGQLCELAGEKTLWVRACKVESSIESGEVKNWEVPNPLPDDQDQATKDYATYVAALVLSKKGDDEKAAVRLLAMKANIGSLPAWQRREQAARILMVSAKARHAGPLNQQFQQFLNSATAYERLDLARKLYNNDNLPLPDERRLDLVLAAACNRERENENNLKLAEELLRNAGFVQAAQFRDALFPLMVAFAELHGTLPERLQAYCDVVSILRKTAREPSLRALQEAKKNLGDNRLPEVEPFVLCTEVLQKAIIDLDKPPQNAQVNDRKNLAFLMAAQAELIRENRNEAKFKDKDGGYTLLAFGRYWRASVLDDAKADYLFGKAKSRVELPTAFANWPAVWLEVDKWTGDGLNRFHGNAQISWLAGWSKLNLALMQKEDYFRLFKTKQDKKLKCLEDSELLLEEAIKGSNSFNPSQLAVLYVDRSEVVLQLGHYFSEMMNYPGLSKLNKAEENRKKHYRNAAVFAEKAEEVRGRLIMSGARFLKHWATRMRILHTTWKRRKNTS